MCQSNGVMLSYPSSSLEDYSCKVNTKALSLTDSANYITTENRKFRHLSISSQPRKPYHIKRNNTNNYRYYFALCLAFENIRRSSVVSYSTFLTIQSADLIKRKEKNESFAQWDTNICTSYGTFSYMRMASKNAREMNKS